MPLVDLDEYEVFKGVTAHNDEGTFYADILPSKKGDKMLVEPRSGGGIRNTVELAVAVAQANPQLEVGFDFSGNYYKVTKDDTVTSAVIRYKDERGIGHIKPGYYLNLTDEKPNALVGVLKKDEANVPLFNVAIDAIRLSRANGGMNIEFQFNRHRFVVGANDDAEEVEKMIPKSERFANVPPPVPKPKPQPTTKLGKFTITGQ